MPSTSLSGKLVSNGVREVKALTSLPGTGARLQEVGDFGDDKFIIIEGNYIYIYPSEHTTCHCSALSISP